MRRIARLAALALSFATLSAAHAAPPAPLIQYNTSGGFVVFNTALKIYADGTVHATRQSVRGDGGTLDFVGYITPAQVTALAHALTGAQFARLPAQVHLANHVADLPSQTVHFGGKTVQLVPMGGPGGSVVTTAFQSALSKLSQVYGTVYGEAYVVYKVTGGWGINIGLTVSRGGQAAYARAGRGPVAQKQAQVPVAQMNALVAAINAAKWTTLPARFTSPHVVMDGTNADVTVYDRHGRGKTVHTQTAARETAAFTHVKTAIGAIIDSLSTPVAAPR